MTQTTDGLGHQTLFQWDELDRQTDITILGPASLLSPAAPLQTTSRRYDAAGNLRQFIDQRGQITTYDLNRFGEVLGVLYPDPDGSGPRQAASESFVLDPIGRIDQHTSTTGLVTDYQYDGLDRLASTSQTDPTTGIVLHSGQKFDLVGRLEYQDRTDATRVEFSDYDHSYDLPKTVTVTPRNGVESERTTHFQYDIAGRLDFTTFADGNIVTNLYDGHDNLIKRTGSIGPDEKDQLVEEAFRYDNAGQMVFQRDLNGVETTYAYNSNGSLRSSTQPSTGTTFYVYDTAGQLQSLTDASDNTTQWVYDPRGLVTRETNQLGQQRVFEYDSSGQLQRRIDRNGDIINYRYDHLGLLIEEKWLDDDQYVAEMIEFEYDLAGRLTGAVSSVADNPTNGVFDILTSVQMQYDAFDGLLAEKSDVDGFGATSLSYRYNDLHQIDTRQLFDSDNTTGQNQVTDHLGYNGFGQLGVLMRVNESDHDGEDSRLVVGINYDVMGRIDDIQRGVRDTVDLGGGQSRVQNFNVVRSDYDYSPMGRITQIKHFDSISTAAHYQYSYDSGSNFDPAVSFVMTIDSLNDGHKVYRHDRSGQLVSADQLDDSVSFSYNATGNRLSVTSDDTSTTYLNAADNRLSSDGVFDFGYDDEGQRIAKSLKPSATLPDGSTAYQSYLWDHRGRLTDIVTLSDATTSATELGRVSYTYDALDRRVAKQIIVGSTVTHSERHVYDGQHLIAVTDDDGRITEQFLHGPMIDQVLAEEHFEANNHDRQTVYFPLGDHQNSARDIIVWDDALNQVTQTTHIDYSAYGEELSNSDPNIQPRFGYTSRDRDTESDLQYNRARYYDAKSGRWISKDPIGFAAGDANLYRYVGNGPTTKTDPSGLVDWDAGTITRPGEFYDKWTEDQRKKWLTDQWRKYGKHIEYSAMMSNVPTDLLTAVVFNEMMDYSVYERAGEAIGAGRSCGPAQLTVDEVLKLGLYPEANKGFTRIDLTNPSTDMNLAVQEARRRLQLRRSRTRAALKDPKTNILILGRMVNRYLELLDDQTGGPKYGKLSKKFVQEILSLPYLSESKSWSFGAEVHRCSWWGGTHHKPSAALIRAIQAMTNSGDAIITKNGVNAQGWEQSLLHIQNAEGLKPYLDRGDFRK